MSPVELHIEEIKEKLRKVVKKENVKSLLKKIIYFSIFTVVFSLILILAEFIGHFSSVVRTVLFWMFISLTAIAFLYFLVFPLLKILFPGKTDYIKSANYVGNYFDEIKDELTNVLQIFTDKKQAVSESLKFAAVEKLYEKTKGIDFSKTIDFNDLKKYLPVTFLFWVVLIVALFLIPGFQASAGRLINFNKDFIKPPGLTFTVEPGNTTVTKGDNLNIKIIIKGKIPSQITFYKKTIEDADFNSKQIKPAAKGLFRLTIKNIKSGFEYYVSGNGEKSDRYTVKVISRPVVANLIMEIFPPGYSHLPNETIKDNGNILALTGSKVKIKLISSKDLSASNIVFNSGKKLPLEISKRIAAGSFFVTGKDEYHFELVDSQGYKNINPIVYSIKLLTDDYPSIQLISPNKNENLPADDKLPLVLKISDDYGLSKLNLNFRLSSSQFNPVEKKFSIISVPISKSQKEQDVFYLWDLGDLDLATNDVVSYYLEVFDNDYVSGPKSAKTPVYTVRVPSLNEILNKADDSQNKATNEIAGTLKEAETLQKELENINNELKQNKKEISWEEKNKIEKSLDKFKKLNDKVQNIQKKLSEMQKDLQKNNLLSKETLKKYIELQKLLDEMNTEEMRKAMEKMQEALQKMMRDKVQNEMNNLNFNEKMFQKSLERTLKLLKRIQIEEKVDELIKRTEELEKSQNELRKETEKTDPKNSKELNKLSKKQEDITKNLKNLENEMKKLNAKMKEFKDMPADDLEKMEKEFQNQKNMQMSEQAKSELSQQMMQKAMRQQSNISQNMQALNKQMKNLQKSLQKQSQLKTVNEMMKITNELIRLSKDQEKLQKETAGLQPSSTQLNRNAEKQFELENNLDKILKQMVELSQKTFAITPEMGRALGKARAEMNKSVGSLQNRNSTIAGIHQNNSMQSLNQAATLMNSAIQNMMNGGSGGGMMSLLQQMQQLSQQQMQINQMTKMLNQGMLTMQQQAQLQRLAQEQAAIQKSLSELNKEAKESGESKMLATNLDKLLQEMKEVVTNMKTKKIDDELVHKQEHILSKMLDVQKSINDRDFEKRRLSESGKQFNLKSPPELMLKNMESKNLIKQELLKAIDEGYSKDYENLIRQYFDALEKESNKN